MAAPMAVPAYYTAPFVQGTLCCPACGHMFPNFADHSGFCVCHFCGTRCRPNPSAGAIPDFDYEAMAVAEEQLIVAIAGRGATAIAQLRRVEKDSRVREEAYCEVCKAFTSCFTYARQTRSADEGQTVFYQCTKCNSEWSLNS